MNSFLKSFQKSSKSTIIPHSAEYSMITGLPKIAQ